MPLHGLVHGRRDSLKGSGCALPSIPKLSADCIEQVAGPRLKSNGRILLEEMKMTRRLWSQTRIMASGPKLQTQAPWLTASSCSSFTHHLTAASRCRPVKNYLTDFHPRRAIYAGKNHEVRGAMSS
jgi:hypothetical protein